MTKFALNTLPTPGDVAAAESTAIAAYNGVRAGAGLPFTFGPSGITGDGAEHDSIVIASSVQFADGDKARVNGTITIRDGAAGPNAGKPVATIKILDLILQRVGTDFVPIAAAEVVVKDHTAELPTPAVLTDYYATVPGHLPGLSPYAGSTSYMNLTHQEANGAVVVLEFDGMLANIGQD